jgi:hypothetical protein
LAVALYATLLSTNANFSVAFLAAALPIVAGAAGVHRLLTSVPVRD